MTIKGLIFGYDGKPSRIVKNRVYYFDCMPSCKLTSEDFDRIAGQLKKARIKSIRPAPGERVTCRRIGPANFYPNPEAKSFKGVL